MRVAVRRTESGPSERSDRGANVHVLPRRQNDELLIDWSRFKEGDPARIVELAGLPVQTIVALVNEHHFDLLVVGFMGHTRLYEQIIGSTTERLVRLAPCTILAVK
jgi:hypothetical protein